MFHARQLEEREEENLQQLHLECSQRATELIDQLSGEEAKELLNEMNSIIPSVVLEVSDILTCRRNQEMGPPPQPSPDREVPGRCVCNKKYILWVHGRLHREDRRVVPSCCLKAKRRWFPDPTGQHKGFVPAFGVGW